MKIFGFGASKSNGTPPDQSLYSQTGLEYRPALAGHPALRIDWFRRIQWPKAEGLDEFKAIRYEKIIKDFCDRVTGTSKWFDICTVDEAMGFNGVKLNSLTKEIYDKLRCLHCVHYENIPPHIVEQIPDMLNAIFTEGDSLTTLEGEVILEEPKLIRNE